MNSDPTTPIPAATNPMSPGRPDPTVPSTLPTTGATTAPMTMSATRTRRSFLQLGTVSVLGLVLAACSDDDPGGGSTSTDSTGDDPSSATTAASSASSDEPANTDPTTTVGADTADTADTAATAATGAGLAALTAADFDGLGTCVLSPESTAGPFPLDEQLDRRDVTEGYPGHPMRLGLRVLDGGCAPVAGAAVEIWHTDASGDYSAFADNGGGKDESSGTTFMRGTQSSDGDGIVEFLTVYPGWYRGRAVHIHLRVHLDDVTVLTSQMYFDEAYTESVYAAEPYAENGLPDTSNAADGIAGDPAADGTLLVTTAGDTARGSGTLARLNLGIDR